MLFRPFHFISGQENPLKRAAYLPCVQWQFPATMSTFCPIELSLWSPQQILPHCSWMAPLKVDHRTTSEVCRWPHSRSITELPVRCVAHEHASPLDWIREPSPIRELRFHYDIRGFRRTIGWAWTVESTLLEAAKLLYKRDCQIFRIYSRYQHTELNIWDTVNCGRKAPRVRKSMLKGQRL